jgi:hypothetical protein
MFNQEGVVAAYLTDPDAIERILPPPLKPFALPVVTFSLYMLYLTSLHSLVPLFTLRHMVPGLTIIVHVENSRNTHSTGPSTRSCAVSVLMLHDKTGHPFKGRPVTAVSQQGHLVSARKSAAI